MSDDDVAQVAHRFGMPREWAAYHSRPHICLDGRNYRATCLVTDPAMEHIATALMESSR